MSKKKNDEKIENIQKEKALLVLGYEKNIDSMENSKKKYCGEIARRL